MKKPWWQILLMLSAIVWTTGLELYFATHHGPTITWLFVHFVPQSLTMSIIGVLVGWIGKHFTDEYRKKKDEEQKG